MNSYHGIDRMYVIEYVQDYKDRLVLLAFMRTLTKFGVAEEELMHYIYDSCLMGG